MANNYISLITKYSTKAFDKVYKQESRSALLDAPSANVQWTGAKTVKIGKFMSGGLNNYYRNNDGDSRVANGTTPGLYGFGYQRSQTGFIWEEFTVKQDRGAQFPIELFDNEETDGQVLGAATTEISRTQIIPEVDAYVFSTLAGYCNTQLGNIGTTTIDKENIYEELNKALLYMDNHEVEADDQIIFVSPTIYNTLRNANKEMSRIVQNDQEKGVKFSMGQYEGRDIVSVAPSRFRTLIDLSGEGVAWASGSQGIDFLVVAKSAVMHVVKYNKVKILEGDVVTALGFDGYLLTARIYHDVFVQDNKRYALYAHVGTSAALDAKLDVTVKDGKIKAMAAFPGDKLFFVGTSTDSSPSVGDTLTNFKQVNVGDATEATKFYAVDSNKKVVAICELA